MHSGEATPTVSPQASWIEVLSTISKGGLGAVNVVDDAGNLVGIVTDGDRRLPSNRQSWKHSQQIQS